jgi:hypothetical protein
LRRLEWLPSFFASSAVPLALSSSPLQAQFLLSRRAPAIMCALPANFPADWMSFSDADKESHRTYFGVKHFFFEALRSISIAWPILLLWLQIGACIPQRFLGRISS